MIIKTEIVRRGEYKCKVFKMYWKLRDQQLKMITYIYRLLYKSLRVSANQKSIIDIHTKKEREIQTKH